MSVTPAPVTSTTWAATSQSRAPFGSDPCAAGEPGQDVEATLADHRVDCCICVGTMAVLRWSGRSATEVPSGAFTRTTLPLRPPKE